MAKAPWARLTKPISPMVTDSPTETMNSTVPAESPPNKIPAKLAIKSTDYPKYVSRAQRSTKWCAADPGSLQTPDPERSRISDAPLRAASRPGNIFFSARRLLLRRARTERQHLALVLDVIDHGELFFVQLAVRAFHHFGQIFVHDDVAGFRIDHDRALRAVELPAEQRLHRLVAVHLALGGLHRVHDGGHAVIAADRGEVGRRIGAVFLLPCGDEFLVLRIVEVGIVVMHGDQADRGVAHALQLDVLDDIARADQL